jgi:hypothetical protein
LSKMQKVCAYVSEGQSHVAALNLVPVTDN